MFIQLSNGVGLVAPTTKGDARVLIVMAKVRLVASENSVLVEQLRRDARNFADANGIDHVQLVQGPAE